MMFYKKYLEDPYQIEKYFMENFLNWCNNYVIILLYFLFLLLNPFPFLLLLYKFIAF